MKTKRQNRRFYRDIISQLIVLGNRDEISDFVTNLCDFWKENHKLYNCFRNIAINQRLIDSFIADFLKITINRPNRADFEDMGRKYSLHAPSHRTSLIFTAAYSDRSCPILSRIPSYKQNCAPIFEFTPTLSLIPSRLSMKVSPVSIKSMQHFFRRADFK